MRKGKDRECVTLLDVLIDGFEKIEVMSEFHRRDLPTDDERAAIRKFAAFVAEATLWKGQPLRTEERSNRRVAAWQDLEIRQAGCGVMVRVAAPWFSNWWHDRATWEGEPMGALYDWLREEEASATSR
jgi:hypothetical protein